MKKKENHNPITRTEFKEEVNKLDQKIDIVDQKVNTLDQKVNTLDQKVNTLDQKVNTIDQKVNRIASELVKTQDDVKEIKEFLKTEVATKEDHQKVINYLDEIVHLNENVNRRLDGHDTRISNHEHRIKHLEKTASK